MNDTQTSDDDVTRSTGVDPEQHPADAIAELDPADAPAAAERYASELAAELEEAGAASADPVQLQADLGDDDDRSQPDT